MTHARHRLFDAKRRDGWMTYMHGTTLAAQWHGRVPIYADGNRLPRAWMTTILCTESCETGATPTFHFRSA